MSMYPRYGSAGGGLLRLHSTYRHDFKLYSSDEGRVQVGVGFSYFCGQGAGRRAEVSSCCGFIRAGCRQQGLLRLHSTNRQDFKLYYSDEGRVQAGERVWNTEGRVWLVGPGNEHSNEH